MIQCGISLMTVVYFAGCRGSVLLHVVSAGSGWVSHVPGGLQSHH